MQAFRSAVFALAASMLVTAAAAAQDQTTVEITPYVGLGTPGASPAGVAVTFPLTSKLSAELDMAYRRGGGGIHALSTNASLLLSLPRVGQVSPYLAAGVGLAQVEAPVYGRDGVPVGAVSSLAPSVNAGGGFKVPVNDTLDLRTDARWFQSFGRHGSEQFRLAQGISFDAGKR